MLEWRLTAVSRVRIAVMVGSQGVLASYIPNCTVQEAVAARAGFNDVSADITPSESTRVAITNAQA
jgi:hypothetical protein